MQILHCLRDFEGLKQVEQYLFKKLVPKTETIGSLSRMRDAWEILILAFNPFEFVALFSSKKYNSDSILKSFVLE